MKKMTSAEQKEITDFLHAHPMATIATFNGRRQWPESALIAFAELPGLELLFETFYQTRKYENLMRDKRVSVVIGWDAKTHVTLQYEGWATLIPEVEVENYITIFLQKDTPCTATFLHDSRVRLFTITPTWLRYSDYTGLQPRIIEHTFISDKNEELVDYH